jgi:glucosylceramidase
MNSTRRRPGAPPRPRKLALLVSIAVTATASIGWLGLGTAQAATGPTVSSWITTPDRAQQLSTGPSQVFDTAGTRPGQMITVNPAQTFQTMDGFGASITDSSAALLYGLSATQRDAVLTSIFHPVSGIGMSMLRQPIGGSDFIDEPHYTYNDLPSGQTDLTMSRFSIAHDEAQILPLLRRARELNPALKVMASPWGQPAWMKANNSIIGGRLKDDPAIFRAYALYLLKFVQAYQAAGVPIYALTVQNEPQNRTPDSYAGTDMPVAHQAAVINELGPMLRDAGLGAVKIISYDHNWAEHPDDIADAAALGVNPEPNYPYDILRTSAAQWIAGSAYHCYSGDVSAQTALHNAFPAKDIWFTECSGWHGSGDSPAQFFADTLKWHAKNIGIGTTQHWAKSVINWNLALNSQGRPVNGGCGDNPAGMCTGVVTIDGSTVTRNAEYYTLGHLSRFVKPGAVRIGSNNTGDVHNVAFRNPDGSFAVLVANTGGGTQTFGVSWNGMVVSYTLTAGAIATLTWPASGGSSPTPSASAGSPTPSAPGSPTPSAPGGGIDPARWYQVINVNSGKCLDDAGWNTGNGAVLQQWTCNSPASANQQWQFRPTSGGYYQVVNRHATSLVWDVNGGSTATGDGPQVHLWSYVGGTNQQWQPASLGAGNYRFTARHSAKCLDVRDVSTADGAWLQQWSCTGGPAQTFRLVAMP